MNYFVTYPAKETLSARAAGRMRDRHGFILQSRVTVENNPAVGRRRSEVTDLTPLSGIPVVQERTKETNFFFGGLHVEIVGTTAGHKIRENSEK